MESQTPTPGATPAGPEPDAPAPIEITFTEAYDRLQRITERLNSNEALPPDQLLELLKTGKGLERVLRAHLDEVEQQVTEIEAGSRYAAFKIVPGAPAATPPATTVDTTDDDMPF